MAELRPLPIGVLLKRMLRELETADAIFDLPRRKFFLGAPGKDLSVNFHGSSASTPLGPAAGPHSQMAQNLVLSWLVGCRVMELKTVQIMDELAIPRPCIDMQTVGYNVEWSQELKLEESLREYVKGAMLIRILEEQGSLPLGSGMRGLIFDMSVGYDLKGIQTERVQTFIRGMKDCRAIVDELRREIPAQHAKYRDLDFPDSLSDTLTLSTFHGCPPDEIERMMDHLLEQNQLHSIVKLNPMLLGPEKARELLHGVMGYDDVRIPDTAFERDTKWPQAEAFIDRLDEKAKRLGLGFGVKFSNTLIVQNHKSFFPATEKEMYLSGPPLYVLAMNLVAEFRKRCGDRVPISFSAGIDRENFADAVALGLVPVTVCSDLLKPGGYARASKYFEDLSARMDAVSARDLPEYIVRAFGLGEASLATLDLDPESPERAACERALADGTSLRAAAGDALFERWLSAARLANTAHYVPIATRDPRYAKLKNQKPPRKVGTHLELFDCLTCDKCVPVCPNDANFSFVLPRLELPIVKVTKTEEGFASRTEGSIVIEKKAQYANFADFCNECGNCDVFCPEDGGPYIIKPRFFGTLSDFELFDKLDGFFLAKSESGQAIHGRFGGKSFRREVSPGGATKYEGEGFSLTLDESDPLATLQGNASVEVDLSFCHILGWLEKSVYGQSGVNYVNS